ncbi:hypothetical protein FOQG_16983 [Fusarium oxysporum f. sp. raphani 54005]|uniref:Uncharacterized protein n=2 Tax=Fusarium oxysporum TaxID=5507 RepID=X0B988_FUSOX|nr:hypothetical protein FOMG_17181 [Fusarium oxysporum f. sp. melonis 26406]EXK78326.1 hypothetical protein FOQG_16983 [Fusarium oxysporum f. sp. raphani 54005]
MTSDAPAADMCQCARAKGEYGTEGELAATVICPDCHLEQSTFPEPDNAEQPDLISERDVYIAFTGSSSLLKIAEKHPNDQSIQKAVKKREKSHQGVKDLINNYGMSNVVTTIRVLLDDHVFTCTDAARHRFPNLFPEEQESQALGSEYSPSKEIADGFEVDYKLVNMAKLSKIADFLLLFLSGHAKD